MTDQLTEQQREVLEALDQVAGSPAMLDGKKLGVELYDPCSGESYDTLRNYILNSASVLEWQPIETAPRDGTEIDLWCDSGPNPCGRQYGRRVGYYYLRGEWVRTDCGIITERLSPKIVTHWMPQPGPPKTEDTQRNS